MAALDPESPSEHVERVYAHYLGAIRRLFERKTRSAELAQEFTQIVYLRLCQSKTLAHVEDPKAYIYRVAWNVLNTEMPRRAREHERYVSLPDDQLEAAIQANKHLWIDDSTAAFDEEYFREGLKSMDPAYREVFELQASGLTIVQISVKTSTSPNTIKKHLAKAWAHLHAHYGDDTSPNGNGAKERK